MERLYMGGMGFPGGAVAVVGTVSRSVIHWFDLTRFCTTVRVSKEE